MSRFERALDRFFERMFPDPEHEVHRVRPSWLRSLIRFAWVLTGAVAVGYYLYCWRILLAEAARCATGGS